MISPVPAIVRRSTLVLLAVLALSGGAMSFMGAHWCALWCAWQVEQAAAAVQACVVR